MKSDETDDKEDVMSTHHRATKVKSDKTDDKEDVINSQHRATKMMPDKIDNKENHRGDRRTTKDTSSSQIRNCITPGGSS